MPAGLPTPAALVSAPATALPSPPCRPRLQAYSGAGSGPIPCNFFVGNRPMVVYRWFSGPAAGGALVASACGSTSPGGDAVVTALSSSNPAGGPWTCLGGDE